jgi:sarcosine oxidase subunit gamma
MAERAEPLAALADRLAAAAYPGASVRAVPFLAQVGLRVDPDGPARARVEAALGAELPGPNRVAASGGRRILWLGPDEWLVTAADGEERALVAILDDALAGDGAAVDLSANRTGLEVAGPDAREALATCCSLDLHPRVFGPGHCAQTLVQKAQVLIDCPADDVLLLLVRPSFAGYVAEWVLDGMAGLTADAAATA